MLEQMLSASWATAFLKKERVLIRTKEKREDVFFVRMLLQIGCYMSKQEF